MRALHTLALAVLLVTVGCLGGTSPGTPTPEATPADSSTTTPLFTSTPTPLDSPPATSECLTGELTVPNATDGVEPWAYPEPPAEVNRSSVAAFVRAFETDYAANEVLRMEERGGQSLTRISASTEIRNVTRTGTGYRIETSSLAVPHYTDSDATGDYGYGATYVVNESGLVRENGARKTVVVRC